jgi:hypothetical protein
MKHEEDQLVNIDKSHKRKPNMNSTTKTAEQVAKRINPFK